MGVNGACVHCGRAVLRAGAGSTILPPRMGRVLDVVEPIGPHAVTAPAPPAAPAVFGGPVAPDKSPTVLSAQLAATWPQRLLSWVDDHRNILFGGLAVFY